MLVLVAPYIYIYTCCTSTKIPIPSQMLYVELSCQCYTVLYDPDFVVFVTLCVLLCVKHTHLFNMKNISDHKMQGNYVQFLLIVFLLSLCTFFPLFTHPNIHLHENYTAEISFNEKEKQVWPFPELKQNFFPQQNVDKGCFGKLVTRQIRKLALAVKKNVSRCYCYFSINQLQSTYSDENR